MREKFTEWSKDKNFNSNVKSILFEIYETFSVKSEDTKLLKKRISFGEAKGQKNRYIIAFWEANSVKLQVKDELYTNNTNFGFGNPSIHEHGQKGYVELKITEASQIDKNLKSYLIKGF